MESCLQRLLSIINYPEPPTVKEGGITLHFDNTLIEVKPLSLALLFTCILDTPEEHLPTLASYATGRVLKEGATLAWDPLLKSLILWQTAALSLDDQQLKSTLEAFLNSCEWWQARIIDLATPQVPLSNQTIYP